MKEFLQRKKAFSANDRRAENILQSTTTKVGDRYQIGLLWKPNVDLHNNRWVAERQLRTLEQRLQKDPTLKEHYKKTIDDDLAKGYIVEVPTVDATLKKWYLPHHPVTNVNKPGKVRRVTNASSVFKGQSLNNNLLTGPDFLCNLTGLIMRFRQHSVAISADIEAMFMQVLVDPKDRQYLRFLWSNDSKTIEFEYTRHIFGATDSPCVVCYAVRKCAKDNEAVYPGLPAIVQRNIYMDDLYVSLTSEEDATDTARKLREVLASGGFNLTKWSSNSRKFLAGLSPELRATGANPDDKLTLQRVLGLPWDPEKDTYLIQPESYRKAKDIRIPTQRNLLKFTSSIFDPLGITAPLIIRLRCIMQLAWSTGQQWDKPIPEDQLAEFQQWTDEIDHLENIQLPRQLHNYRSQPEHHELHVFSDASEKAFAAVAYLRTTHNDSHVSITFLIGKMKTTHNSELRTSSSHIRKPPCYLHQRRTRPPHSSDIHVDGQYNRFTLDQRL